jgi:hypothetical protein
MKKKLLLALLAFLLVLSICNPVLALENEEQSTRSADGDYQILWTYINLVSNWMDISSSGQASMTSVIYAYSGVDKVVMNNYLQRLVNGSWTTVKNWSNTYYDDFGSWSQTWYVTSGYNYRLRTYFYAYDGSSSESTSLTSGTVYY